MGIVFGFEDELVDDIADTGVDAHVPRPCLIHHVLKRGFVKQDVDGTFVVLAFVLLGFPELLLFANDFASARFALTQEQVVVDIEFV